MTNPVHRYYKVFISSTFRDLSAHRQQAILGILKAGHMPVALENFAPDTESKRTVIADAMATCQYYVIILGSRYGTIPEDQDRLPINLRNKSYTEIELDMAKDARLPILAFIMDSDEINTIRKTDEWIQSPERLNVDKYENLRRRLSEGIENIFSRPFSRAEDIMTELYAHFKEEHPKIRGYIREPEIGSDVDIILRLSSANQVARDVIDSLGFSDVDPRLGIASGKKEALADTFLDLYGDSLDLYGDSREGKFSRVFFESGSTITYLARRLSKRLPKRGKGRDDSKSLLVLTNNAFAYLYLWLCSGVMCHPVPEGPPDHTYGGMYGPLTNRHRCPNYDLPPLEKYDPDAFKLIQSLKTEVFPDLQGEKESLLLAATSGLQVSDDVIIKELRMDSESKTNIWYPSTNTEIRDCVRKCRGFHVGSYQNMLFKRCYYLTKIPTVVFIHDDKVDCEVKVGKCHYLFDQGVTWDSFFPTYPLSIWIACEQNTYSFIMEKCKRHFSRGDWAFIPYGQFTTSPIVIGHNKAFRDALHAINVRFLE
jgi:hypothetical protein